MIPDKHTKPFSFMSDGDKTHIFPRKPDKPSKSDKSSKDNPTTRILPLQSTTKPSKEAQADQDRTNIWQKPISEEPPSPIYAKNGRSSDQVRPQVKHTPGLQGSKSRALPIIVAFLFVALLATAAILTYSYFNDTNSSSGASVVQGRTSDGSELDDSALETDAAPASAANANLGSSPPVPEPSTEPSNTANNRPARRSTRRVVNADPPFSTVPSAGFSINKSNLNRAYNVGEVINFRVLPPPPNNRRFYWNFNDGAGSGARGGSVSYAFKRPGRHPIELFTKPTVRADSRIDYKYITIRCTSIYIDELLARLSRASQTRNTREIQRAKEDLNLSFSTQNPVVIRLYTRSGRLKEVFDSVDPFVTWFGRQVRNEGKRQPITRLTVDVNNADGKLTLLKVYE